MLATILKHVAFLLFAPIVVGAIVLSPLVARVMSDAVESQKKPKLVTLYDDVENTLPPTLSETEAIANK